MHPVHVNYLAILVAAIVMMAVGFAWHGPLFGKVWVKLQKLTPSQVRAAARSGMLWRNLAAFGAFLVMSWVLAHAVIFAGAYMKMNPAANGLVCGFMNWLGFVAPVTLGTVLWERKSFKLWLFTNGYYLLSLLLMGLILGLWR